MPLSRDLISEFVKVTKDEVEVKREATTYGTVFSSGDRTYVKLDGSDLLTPIESTASVENGDRVTVLIKDHTATVTGNLTDKSAGTNSVTEVKNDVTEISGKITSVETLVADKVDTKTLDAEIARINTLEADTIKVGDITSESGTFNYLSVENLNAQNARIETLEADTIKVNDIVGETGSFNYLDVDNLNANYAVIKDGIIQNAAVSDAQIISVSANKLTTGTIDASNITVTNLNADNITVGTINGKRIGNESITLDKLAEEVPTKEYLDNLAETMQNQIDGAIETWRSDTVPTLNNYPASEWVVENDDAATLKEYRKHVGDLLYVVNAASSADGYCYRFLENNYGTFSWELIKDNDVTEALQRIIDAEGDLSGLKDFESSTSKWISDTDEALKTTYITNTKLTDELGNYVESSTFNSRVESALENSATITSLTEKLDIDPETGEAFTTLTNKVNEVKQTADGISTRVSSLEEIQSANETRMSTMETNISANSEAINLRATKTEAQGYADSALESAKTYTTSQGYLTVESDAIKVMATKKEAQGYANSALSDAKTYATSQGYLTVTSDAITSKVSKDNIISEINQSAESITIDASKVNLNGYVTFSNLSTSGQTNIDGGNITTGTINTDRLNVEDIFAKDITATGNIQFKNGNRYWITADDSGDTTIATWGSLSLNGQGSINIENDVGYINLTTPGSIALNPGDENSVVYKDDDNYPTINYYPFLNTKNTADHIVAQGTSGIWTYRKWNSGLAECFGTYAISPGKACNVAFGSGTGWYRTEQISVGSYPFTFASMPSVLYSYNSGVSGVGAFIWVSDKESTTSPSAVHLCRPSSSSALYGYIIIHAFGRWKS